jgi:aminoglycoside phosphotransferase (APT) family kinase protein
MTTRDEGLAERLESRLSSRAPELGLKRVASVKRFPGGLSSQSFRVEAETVAGPVTWVIRREPENGVIPPYNLVNEGRLMANAGRTGLPVPEILYLEEDPGPLGGQFILMSYIEGEMFTSADPRLAADNGLRETLQRNFVSTLARIHNLEQDVLPNYPDGPTAARAQIEVCRRRLAETEYLPRPLLSHALDVLDDRAPDCPKTVLLHGDYRLPNLKWSMEGEVRGILDWELAFVGDPMADIAFTQIVGGGYSAISDDLAKLYTEQSGFEVDEGRLGYYRLLELVKGSIIGYGSVRDLAEGGSDLRMFSVAGLASTAETVAGMFQISLNQTLEA